MLVALVLEIYAWDYYILYYRWNYVVWLGDETS